jgi:hypothetical protein
MLEGTATVKWDSNRASRFGLSPLQIAEIAAHAHGFYDIDLKDNDVGSYTIIAYSAKSSVSVKGKTIEAAVERLLERLGC